MTPPTEQEFQSDVLAELDQVKDKDRPDYSDGEIKYIRGLQTRLERAFSQRNQARIEFDGMTYQQYWEANEKGANTLLQPKQNREDSNFQSGTIRQKLLALLAAGENLDLGGDVRAFDENELEINSLGDAIEDTMEKVEELDNDAEKKTRRQHEILKHGDVFVEPIWDEK